MFFVLLCLFTVQHVYAQEDFNDIRNDYWAKESIDYLSDSEIINGYSDGSFKPNQTITRIQTAIMITKALDLDTTNLPSIDYKDVSEDMTGYKSIAAVTKEGIFSGSNGQFMPYKPLTRAEMAVVLTSMYEIDSTWEEDFTDISSNHWAYHAIETIADYGITTGYPDKTFRPNNPTTRAQFSVFMHNVLENEAFDYSSTTDEEKSDQTTDKDDNTEDQAEESEREFTFKGIGIGDSEQTVLDVLGEPKRIDQSRKSYQWYIYSDEQKALQIGIQDNEVVAVFTNADMMEHTDGLSIHHSTNEDVFELYGEKEMDSSFGTTDTPYMVHNNSVKFYFDRHNNHILSGVYIFKNSGITSDNITSAMLSDWEKEIFEQTNSFRYKYNKNPVKHHETAATTAREHSTDMLNRDYFDHVNPDGLDPFDRMSNNGINYTTAGENIAFISGGVFESFDLYYLWVNSLGHRQTMLNENFTHLGVGLDGKDRAFYGTQNFVTPFR